MRPVGLLVTSAAFGLWTFSTIAAPLSPEEAARHIGETATVCGVVVSAEYEPNEQSQPTPLDLGKPFPNAIFAAVIYGDSRPKFGTPGDLIPQQADLCDGADQRLPGEAGDRPYRSEPVDGVVSTVRL